MAYTNIETWLLKYWHCDFNRDSYFMFLHVFFKKQFYFKKNVSFSFILSRERTGGPVF